MFTQINFLSSLLISFHLSSHLSCHLSSHLSSHLYRTISLIISTYVISLIISLIISHRDPSRCRGASKDYRSCKTQVCPDGGTRTFRDLQCERFNNQTFEGRYYRWEAFWGAPNPCELNCKPVKENFYYRHAPRVVDGTRCYEDSQDICVDGKCQAVGCDKQLFSRVKFDRCGVCGGDGSTCDLQQGVFILDNIPIGYNDMLFIPKGATSVKISERQATSNYLAIRNRAKQYYLNGNWRISHSKEVDCAGTTFLYRRQYRGYQGLESLSAPGPTTEDLYIVLILQDDNPGVRYEYALPVGARAGDEVLESSYSWIVGQYGECSKTCGGGYQLRSANCATTTTYAIVSDYNCDPLLRPTNNRTCNQQSCPPGWYIGEWEECSKPCLGGVQTRTVFCSRLVQGSRTSLLDEECREHKPDTLQTCNQNVTCPQWEVGVWAKCNKVCGPGEQLRSVICKAADGRSVSPTYCDRNMEPVERQLCESGPCEGLEWMKGPWQGCDRCGLDTETRNLVCTNREGTVYPDDLCAGHKKPNTSRSCEGDVDTCNAQWFMSQWSECSTKCGTGVQNRLVLCSQMDETDSTMTILTDDECKDSEKPELTQSCERQNCTGQWFEGPWTKCSVMCGGGEMKRQVHCINGREKAEDSECDKDSQPDVSESCNQHACDDDEIITVGPNVTCEESEFGCCADNVTLADSDGCPGDYNVSTLACNETVFGCCIDGLSTARGPYFEGCDNITMCNETRFGCCPDHVTPAKYEDGGGCPEVNCHVELFGCCPDNVTSASGEDYAGCADTVTTMVSMTTGDNETSVSTTLGPTSAVTEEEFLEVTDDMEVTSSGDEEMSGSGDMEDCSLSLYGCCKDGVTIAKGPDKEGCEVEMKCYESEFGCCPDGVTPAGGEWLAGCENLTCADSQYGCCLDGVEYAEGPGFSGCGGLPGPSQPGDCSLSSHGCCIEGSESAAGDVYEECLLPERGCRDTKYGCCADGQSIAEGPHQEACREQAPKLSSCGEAKDQGTCRNFTVRWYFDMDYGGCNRFWYGGCGGNDNRFLTKDECAQKCVDPKGRDVCYLPKVSGRCRGNTPSWYYNVHKGRCEPFIYGGCLGNNNRFGSEDECKARCEVESSDKGALVADVCDKHEKDGPCEGEFLRWRYHGDENVCQPFTYGGCKANENNFITLENCNTHCQKPWNDDQCQQVMVTGSCHGNHSRYYFDSKTLSCQRFRYGGCQGNDNRFFTEDVCEGVCAETKEELGEVCLLAKDPGPCRSAQIQWYYDVVSGQCRQFYYGGCEGNGNRFDSEEECEGACADVVGPKQPDRVCAAPKDAGPCQSYTVRWYYEGGSRQCKQFYYGGCGGNTNNFYTREECEGSCIDGVTQTGDPCHQPREKGTCSDQVIRWYFEPLRGSCMRFYYTGCGGNNNNFESVEGCERKCVSKRPTTPTQPTPSDVCTLAGAVAGRCDERHPRWYYDARTDECNEFIYTGCEGNDNNFISEEKCLQQCKPTADVCYLEYDPGPCSAHQPSWYYDVDRRQCMPFIYGGCQGNYNRYPNMDACDRQCGLYKGQDVCRLAPDGGRGRLVDSRWYYDTRSDTCKQFTYAGSYGNANRFMSEMECVEECGGRGPTTPPEQDPCTLRRDPGPCYANVQQWFYDETISQCRSFTYGGCGGNKNRFNSEQSCERSCGTYKGQDICKLTADPGPCDSTIPTWYHDSKTSTCLQFTYGGCDGNGNRFASREECDTSCGDSKAQEKPECDTFNCDLQCPYGFVLDDNRCETCKCSNPCRDHNCPQDMDCAVQQADCIVEPCPTFRGVCRYRKKPGVCPEPPSDQKGVCVEACKDDAGCNGNHKCCSNGCGRQCQPPKSEDIDVSKLKAPCQHMIYGCCPDNFTPARGPDHYGCPEEGSLTAPVMVAEPRDERVVEKTHITFTCISLGNPTPQLTWSHDGVSVDEGSKDGRVSLRKHRLIIRDVKLEDAGEYMCNAFNGQGSPVRSSALLVVEAPPSISGPAAQPITGGVGRDIDLPCDVRGYPTPRVLWQRGVSLLPHPTYPHILHLSNNSLRLSPLREGDEGIYSCVARNGIGLTARKIYTLKLEGLVSAKIYPHRQRYQTGSRVRLHCAGRGYPLPRITWSKDSQNVVKDERHEWYTNGTLVIRSVHQDDSGLYKCSVVNDKNTAQAETRISITGTHVAETCQDNPYLANCKLIVEARFCSHKYYAKFCCRSCTESGQLR